MAGGFGRSGAARAGCAERPRAQLEVLATLWSEVNTSCRNTLMLAVLVLGAIATTA